MSNDHEYGQEDDSSVYLLEDYSSPIYLAFDEAIEVEERRRANAEYDFNPNGRW